MKKWVIFGLSCLCVYNQLSAAEHDRNDMSEQRMDFVSNACRIRIVSAPPKGFGRWNIGVCNITRAEKIQH